MIYLILNRNLIIISTTLEFTSPNHIDSLSDLSSLYVSVVSPFLLSGKGLDFLPVLSDPVFFNGCHSLLTLV